MPEISRFLGIVIAMYYNEHNPPHFHAKYGDFAAFFDIETGDMVDGNMPRRAVRLIQDWAELNKTDLLNNWFESQKDLPDFHKINPLE